MTDATPREAGLILNDLASAPPLIESAEGVWLIDTEDRRYLDASSGAVVTSLGHAHPRVLSAMAEQARKVAYVNRSAFSSEGALELARRLTKATGYAGAWLVNSGSEAVEAALQFALQFHRERGQERTWFLSHDHSFHGSTLGALSLSGHARRESVGTLAYGFNVLPSPYGDGDRAPRVDELLADVRAIVGGMHDRVAGIVVEPLSGATLGANPVPDGYLQGLREICDENGILLITDEVMTGLGRTGRMLAGEHWEVRADIVAVGKGLGAGYAPIAATLLSESLVTTISTGTGRFLGGHTYAGNPLSTAVADEVLAVTLEQELVAASDVLGRILRDRLDEVAQRHRLIRDVRGLGLLQGVEFDSEALPGPQGTVISRVLAAGMAHGILLYPATGGYNDACLIAPPLTITRQEISDLIVRFESAVGQVESEAGMTPLS